MLGFLDKQIIFRQERHPVSIQCRNIGLNGCIYQLEKLVRIGFLAGIIGKKVRMCPFSELVRQMLKDKSFYDIVDYQFQSVVFDAISQILKES